MLDSLTPGDMVTVTRLDRLARSTRDLLNTLAAITAKEAGFKSLGDTWVDTTTSHGRLMLTALGGLAEFERDLIHTHSAEGATTRAAHGPTAEIDPDAKGRGPPTTGAGRDACRTRAQLPGGQEHDFEIKGIS